MNTTPEPKNYTNILLGVLATFMGVGGGATVWNERGEDDVADALRSEIAASRIIHAALVERAFEIENRLNIAELRLNQLED